MTESRHLPVLDFSIMNLARWSVSLVAVIGLLAATIAGAAIWLIVSDPVSVANAVSTGDVTPIMQAIGAVIFDALKGLFKYL
jgi:hypothetical protein